jgi:hypothetical protein
MSVTQAEAHLGLADLDWAAGDRAGARAHADAARAAYALDGGRDGLAAVAAWLRAHPAP